MDKEQAEALIKKYLAGQCSPEEESLVEDWYSHLVETKEIPPVPIDYDMLEQRIYSQVLKKAEPLVRLQWWQKTTIRWAAALGILAISLVIYLLLQSDQYSGADYATFNQLGAPGGNHAKLTLSDGSLIDLDTLQNGTLVQTNDMVIKKTDEGELIYESNLKTSAADATKLHKIETPKGGQFMVNLSDGSKVWLNAASSLTYSLNLGTAIREVTLTGEAYFEVATDSRRPFIVHSNNQDVKVLGTAFNISTYDDERSTVTTVSEGSVLVAAPEIGKAITLKPNTQSILHNGLLSEYAVEAADFTSWHDGVIVLHNADLPTILRQVSRWYDVTFEIPDLGKTEAVYGELKRTLPLSQLLESLSANYHIKFKKEERRIVVYR